jgi:hypothetical protein
VGSWWSQKLNGGTAAPQAPATAPQTYVQRQVTQPQPQVGQQVVSGQQKLDNVSFTEALALAEQGVIITQGDPRGAARFEKDSCPECGSASYFSRTQASGSGSAAGGRVMNTQTGLTATAAPICFDCGYRGGIYPQQTGEIYRDVITAPEEE